MLGSTSASTSEHSGLGLGVKLRITIQLLLVLPLSKPHMKDKQRKSILQSIKSYNHLRKIMMVKHAQRLLDRVFALCFLNYYQDNRNKARTCRILATLLIVTSKYWWQLRTYTLFTRTCQVSEILVSPQTWRKMVQDDARIRSSLLDFIEVHPFRQEIDARLKV